LVFFPRSQFAQDFIFAALFYSAFASGSLLTGTAVIGAFETFQKGAHKFRIAICSYRPLSGMAGSGQSATFFFSGRSLKLTNGQRTNPFPESIKIGEYLRAQSTPSDTIAVLGFRTTNLFLRSTALRARKYIYTYGLMEPQPYAHPNAARDDPEIETARPKFLVLVVINKSWLAGRDSEPNHS